MRRADSVLVDDGQLLSMLRGLVVRIDQAGRILDARGAIDGIAGYTSAELIGMTAADLISPADYEAVMVAFGQEGGAPIYDRPLPFPLTLVSRTGEPETCDVLPVGFVDEDGAGWVSMITPRRLYSAAYDIIDSVLDGAPLGDIANAVAERDAESYQNGRRVQTTYVVSDLGSPDVRVHMFEGDRGFADALIDEARRDHSGLDEFVDDGAIQSMRVPQLAPRLAVEAQRCGYQVAHVGAVSDGGSGRACVFWMVTDGRSLLLRHHAELTRNGLLRLIRSTLSRERAERVLLEQATMDSLTGLGNRRFFEQQVDALAAEHAVSVLYVDLDRFKAVNDDYGHDVGDRVLAAVGSRLTAACRGDSVVARIGGDEFAVLLPGASANDAAAVAERVREAIAEPLLLELGPSSITATVGTCTSPGGTAVREVVINADLAMLANKRDRPMIEGTPAPA